MNFNAETRTSYLLEQILVTPDMAARFLEKNLISNRKISPTRVSKLAAAMQSGDFIIGDPLKFDKNDVLIDGQHRLTALIKARVTIEFLVIKGYDERVSTVLDIGAQRSCADIARLSGYQEITATHIAIFNGMILQHITSRCANYLSKHEIIDLTSKYFNSIVF